MDHPLTHAETRLVVREFMARQEVRERRKRFFRIVFVVGIGSAIAAGILSCFVRRSLGSGLFGLSWAGSCLLYTEFLTIPQTYMQDMDLRWHLNPWQEALQRLADDDRQTQGIVLLTVFPVLQMVASFVYFGLK
jgi:hypothetical protein